MTLRVFTPAELRAEAVSLGRRRWLWDGIIPSGGRVLLAGEPLVGKTRLLTALAAHMAHAGLLGAPARTMAGRTVSPGRTLYLAAEHDLREVSATLDDALRGAGVALDTQDVFVGRAASLEGAGVAELAEAATTRVADMVVIDPLRATTTLDENSSLEVAELRGVVDQLTSNGQRTVVVVHHLSRGGSVRGSTDLEAQMDSIVRVTRCAGGVQIVARHHSAPELRLRVRIDHDGGEMHISAGGGETPANGHDRVLDAVRAAVEHHPGASKRDIRAAVAKAGVRVSHPETDRALRVLADMGVIENAGNEQRHEYRLVDTAGVGAAP